MFGAVVATCAAVVALAAQPLIPAALAAEGDVVVRVQDGAIRCLLSADDVPRGGGPMAVCQKTDGTPFGMSPPISHYSATPSQAVVRGTGEMFWFAGTLPPADGDVVLAPGQTYRANGWTVRDEDYRTFVVNDRTTHGYMINVTEMRQI